MSLKDAVEVTHHHHDPARSSAAGISPPGERYRSTLFDDFFAMESSGAAKATQSAADAPPLPERNAMRASRLLDNLGLKLGGGGSLEALSLATATPHDVYLSSEEDASSSAGEFSDYDYESSNDNDDDHALPPARRRSSHEDTARVVSVVYAGKPSIIDLSEIRRSGSRGSAQSRPLSTVETTTTASSGSGSEMKRRMSAASATSLSSLHQPPRKSMLSTLLLSKHKPPPFLTIDPYANGSTYSLEIPREEDAEDPLPAAPPRTPRTPTALIKGVSRTFSLVRKRSRPLLQAVASASASSPSRDTLALPPPTPSEPTSPAHLELPQQQQQQQQQTHTTVVIPPPPEEASPLLAVPETPRTPQSPVTYNDIIRAAKKNARLSPGLQPPSGQLHLGAPPSPVSPLSPSGAKKGFLGGLAARRRSIKMVNGRLL